jgi:hypothetical protein
MVSPYARAVIKTNIERRCVIIPDRIIKESCCISETLQKLTDFEERFWWRLTVNCDDYGRFDARPAVLKSRLFPLADSKTLKDMMKALKSLASVGLIEIYEVDGKSFLQVVKWEKHQRIRAKRSKFPSPAGTCQQMTASDGKCPRNPIQSNPNPNPNPNPIQGAHAGVRDDFALFWEAYPRKEGMLKAEEAFAKVVVPVQDLLDAIEAQKNSPQWKKENGLFIPHPAKWLEEKRWLDQTVMETPKGATGYLGEAELAAIKKMLGKGACSE